MSIIMIRQKEFWIDLIFLVFTVLLVNLNWIGFPWKMLIVALVVVGFAYWRTGELMTIGLGKHHAGRTILWALGITLIVVILVGEVMIPWLEQMLGEKTDYSAYGELEGNFEVLFQLWWKAMLSAAIAEEIYYRGFVMSTLERMIGAGAIQKIIILVVMSAYFGVMHNFQGTSGVIGITITALVFGAAFYLSKRNLWALFIAHALIDTWGLFSLYHGGIDLI